MRLSPERLSVKAETTGLCPEVLEKVIHLLNLLDAFRRHPSFSGDVAWPGRSSITSFGSNTLTELRKSLW